MRLVLLLALAGSGCRTRPIDGPAAPAPDLQAPADAAASGDLAAVHCPARCDPATELCVFLNRGDCSKWTCAPRPAACATPPTCACLGDHFCAAFSQGPGETLTCRPPDPGLGGDVVCVSNIQCV